MGKPKARTLRVLSFGEKRKLLKKKKYFQEDDFNGY